MSDDKPNGGFPPIYFCSDKKKDAIFNEDEDKKRREYSSHKTAVSIKNILEKRRKVTPFVNT